MQPRRAGQVMTDDSATHRAVPAAPTHGGVPGGASEPLSCAEANPQV